jgi:hypothetical protein
MFTKKTMVRTLSVLIAVVLMLAWIGPVQAAIQPTSSTTTAVDPTPPTQTVKLIFIHHSTGENWLKNDYGNLGLKLGENNYFVSDTNYGWGPNHIGDRTDIPDWMEWFRSPTTTNNMNALFAESGQNSSYTRTLSNPGGQNTIIMFKSCFPNSNLEGNPDDPPDPTPGLTVGHAKYVYNELLKYFRSHPDKLFVVITAPPVTSPTYAANARAFNNWLYNDWLAANSYPFSNVAVFDFYNVLTDLNAHHRYNTTTQSIEHIVKSKNTLYYPSGDDHPSKVGSQKATTEFIPLLNIFYNRWKAEEIPQTSVLTSDATQDGWVLETAENSTVGGTLNNATTLRLGDDKMKKQYRSILSFNTGGLPDNAVITKVTLKVKKQGITGGGNPVTAFQGFMLDIKKGRFGTTALEAGDFQIPASKTYGPFSPTATNNWYSINLTNGKGYINKSSTLSGLTQVRLRFQLDDNDNAVANYLSLYSGDAPAGSQPRLIIEYYVP